MCRVESRLVTKCPGSSFNSGLVETLLQEAKPRFRAPDIRNGVEYLFCLQTFIDDFGLPSLLPTGVAGAPVGQLADPSSLPIYLLCIFDADNTLLGRRQKKWYFWVVGARPDHNFRPKNYHFLFLLPFDAEAFKTCKNTLKLINLCALPCLGLGLWLTLTVFFDLA